jgi:hypothetical protein
MWLVMVRWERMASGVVWAAVRRGLVGERVVEGGRVLWLVGGRVW